MGNVIAVDEATFDVKVIERSRSVPVVVDFWASWCGPCRALSPILERLADEAAGAWILATVDVDQNQALAATYRVQGIPAVHGFRDGREVARFVGALPEQQVRAWLTKLGPSEADVLVERARDHAASGDHAAAAAAYERALALEPARRDAVEGLARARLALRVAAGEPPADPLAAVLADADRLAATGDLAGAADVLVARIREAAGDERDRLRAHLVSLLDTVAPDDPVAVRARRDLAAALF